MFVKKYSVQISIVITSKNGKLTCNPTV